MIRIVVHSGEARTITFQNKRTGQPDSFRVQEAYGFPVNDRNEPAPYPEKFELTLNRDQSPYAPGEYLLHPSAVYFRDGRMHVAPRLATAKRPA